MRVALAAHAARAVPRYTSYPTAPHFTEAIDESRYRDWLANLDPALPLSLYLHVPFCRKMCWYCGCHTKIVARYDPVRRYASVLLTEIDLLADQLPGKFDVSHVHWGGGTPTILEAADFKEIMSRIRARFNFSGSAEKAVEIDPRTVDTMKIAALAEAGINRASLGIQDFSPVVQQAINRVQSFEVTRETVKTLRENGISKLNFDLMYGLPLQTEEDVLNTVNLSHALRPDRIALFGYAHVPWMKSHMKMIRDADLPDSAARIHQADVAAMRLKELGYVQIGLDHFAHADDPLAIALEEGRLNRNFQGYTTDIAENLIGLGASAIGRLAHGYVQNAAPIAAYEKAVIGGEFPIVKGVELSADDRLRRRVIERLMCDSGVDLGAVASDFGVGLDYFEDEMPGIREYCEDGIATFEKGRLALTEEGRPLVRTVCALFDRYLGSGAARHSRAV
ncbi:MAG: oxygen-independent coproporphyrinogen III oxidase [Alphaproteobacteria bacterium]|nr:MAG: oxygen-independent coproporphyrinogen III oxidase [Alphaproteobacteria bacterium]